MPRFSKKMHVWAALLVVAAIASPASTALADRTLAYGGRFVDKVGKPVSGPVTLRVRFYPVEFDGTASSVTPADILNVPLANGVFQVNLSLPDADFETIFQGGAAVWIEVTDVTHGRTYPRQRFGVVPFALKIPTDAKVFDYDSDGELTLSAPPETGKYLSADVNGQLEWVAITGVGIGDMLGANNLSELTDQSLAQTNLGLGAAATLAVGTGAGTVAAGDHLHSAATTAVAGYLSAADKTKLDGLDGTLYVQSANNVGTAGVGVYKQKTGSAVELKKLNPASNKITVVDDAANSEIDFDVVEANLALNNLSGTLAVNKGGTGLTSASANFVFAGPTGSAGAPAFRALVGADYPAMIGDSGAGGTTGAVPAPATGDAAKFLKGDGTWATPSTSAVGVAGLIQYSNGSSLAADAGLSWNATKGILAPVGAGSNNLFIGTNAGTARTTGVSNTFVGSQSGAATTTGNENALFGMNAGAAITTGFNNTISGANAGAQTTTGAGNVFVGNNAGQANVTGQFNTFVGNRAGLNTTAHNNVFVGTGAGMYNTTASQNTFVGNSAGYFNTTGAQNSFLGDRAGQNTTTGASNTFVGSQAGYTNVTGNSNTFTGYSAGYASTGTGNSFFGTFSGQNNTTGGSNTFVGYLAGANVTTPSFNTFIGRSAGNSVTTGQENTIVGAQSGNLLTTGGWNSTLGDGSGANMTTAFYNTLLGATAGNSLSTGGANIFIGYNSGINVATGSSNIAIGQSSGNGVASGNAIAIGTNAVSTASESIVIGSNVTNSTTGQIVLGNVNNFVTIGSTAGDSNSKLTIDRSSDGNLIAFKVNGVTQGQISVSGGTVTYGAFTGSHYALIAEPDVERGMLVRLTGRNTRSGSGVGEIIYGATTATGRNDKRVLGAYLGRLDPSRAADIDNPHLVMALGNGEIWVSDAGGDIGVGDDLIASDTPGVAQKDDGLNPISNVVAWAAEDIAWHDVVPGVDGVRRRLLPVIFDRQSKVNGH